MIILFSAIALVGFGILFIINQNNIIMSLATDAKQANDTLIQKVDTLIGGFEKVLAILPTLGMSDEDKQALTDIANNSLAEAAKLDEENAKIPA